MRKRVSNLIFFLVWYGRAQPLSRSLLSLLLLFSNSFVSKAEEEEEGAKRESRGGREVKRAFPKDAGSCTHTITFLREFCLNVNFA